MNKDFLTLARRLREVQDMAPDIFSQVIEAAGLGKRRAYALVQIHNSFRKLDFDRERLLAVGWTKALTIAPHVNQQTCEELPSLAAEHTDHDLAITDTGGPINVHQHVVLHNFSRNN